jgi:peptidoglycan/xylan/chitin deacetylase (PgdA/CDA1 family)
VIWRIVGLVALAALALAEVAARLLRLTGALPAVSRPTFYAVALALAGLVLVGMLERRASLFGRVFWRGPSDRRLAALTFDDGPSEAHTPRILDVLADRGVQATFFVIGRHAEGLPAVVARAAREGHQIGNHGYDHRVLPLHGPAFTREQISRTSEIIHRACGTRPVLFRAPRGWRNPWVNRVARSRGCTTVGWTLGVWDTDRPGAEVIVERVRRGIAPGCVLLLHDGRGMEPGADASQIVQALPAIIDLFEAGGYRLVTISEMMRESRWAER